MLQSDSIRIQLTTSVTITFGYSVGMKACSRWLSVSDTTGYAFFRLQHPERMPELKGINRNESYQFAYTYRIRYPTSTSYAQRFMEASTL
jgi:hypothetical protein